MPDARNLQHRVYDVTAAAAECNRTQAHCAREAVIECHYMEAPLCGEGTSSRSLGNQASGFRLQTG